MPKSNLSVAARLQEIKKIFNDFGIPVIENSALEQTIKSEFGRGKRSILTKIITDLQQDSDATVLAECIGHALDQKQDDPKIKATAAVMRERIPSLLHICDIRQQTSKRIDLLQELLSHFEQKLTTKATKNNLSYHEQRLVRMISSARIQVQGQQQLDAVGEVIYRAGVVCDLRDLKRFGKILQSITPILIAISNSQSNKQQVINHCINALRLLGRELQKSNLTKIASILEDIHNFALVVLPQVPDNATINSILKNLGISMGNITINKLSAAARSRGITEQELLQILYNNQEIKGLEAKDQELLVATQQNQRFAAACGLLTKFAQEIECKELERVGIASMCLVCMRQTYYEVKTKNVNLASFSESLGLLLTGVGVLSKNQTIVKIGTCILDGVRAYAGIMAIPGAQPVAVPLAICAALGKLVIGNRVKPSEPSSISEQELLQRILQQTISLHLDMRQQFYAVFNLLQAQHKEYILALDQGFAQLACYVNLASQQSLQRLQVLDHKIDVLQFSISKEFSDLYLEYIRDPLEEVEFFNNYKQGDVQQLNKNKLKLNMWLLYKSKHCKANGKDLITPHENTENLTMFVSLVLRKIRDYDAVLGMVNRYANLEFSQRLPEELPHIPTWILCANTYIFLLQNYGHQLQDVEKEPQIIQDVIAVGEQVLEFVANLAENKALFERVQEEIMHHYNIALQEYQRHVATFQLNVLEDITKLKDACLQDNANKVMCAHYAPIEQLEAFDPVTLDITRMWQEYLHGLIPVECWLAQYFNLGAIYITYTIDATVNTFAEVPAAYSHTPLPDSSRDIIFRLNVYFKTNSDTKTLLTTAWFAYDLGNGQRRFDEYYQRKFKYGLRHYRYLWVSINGQKNQVAGNPITETNKPIDYQRLATVYQQWWLAAQPVHLHDTMRLRQNKAFMQKIGDMLDRQQCVQVMMQNIDLIKLQLDLELQRKIFEKRMLLSSAMQNLPILGNALSKIDAYHSVLAVYQQILNYKDISEGLAINKFNQLLQGLAHDVVIATNFADNFINLFKSNAIIENNPDFKQGVFYQKVQLVVTQLRLLLVTMHPILNRGTLNLQVT